MIHLRPARLDEARIIAEFVRMASDGVSDYVWKGLAEPGEDLLDIGARRFSREGVPMSYGNCTMAIDEADSPLGLVNAYAMIRDDTVDIEQVDAVLRPYAELEAYDTLYISSMAVRPDQRGVGIGRHLLEHAIAEAEALDLQGSSLLVFEGNTGAVRLYQRYGFQEVDRRPVVSHEMIQHQGDCLLMVRGA